jgi:aspartyl-tRNA(Asn)/glutamyl-tRNA(Gln) amidotransferase subunit A
VACHLPSLPRAIPAYYVLCTSEASSNLARYDGVRYGLRVPGEDLETMYARTRAAGFGPEVKRPHLLGTFALRKGYAERYYGRATELRAQLRHELEEAFERCDVLAMPTAPTVAWKARREAQRPARDVRRGRA